MSGYDEPQAPGDDGQYPGDASGHLNPVLAQQISSADTPMGRAWTTVAANRVQDYLTTKAVAEQNQAAGDQFVNNLADTKNNLVGMVQGDPGSMGLALDLAQHSVNGIVDQHQHMDDDARQGAADDLIGHMQTEIAHAGVQRLAETDKGAALQALDKYGSYLPDEQQSALRQYADVQEGLRGQDAFAQQQQASKDAAVAGYHSATSYLGALADPDTGQFRSPQGFLQGLVADPSIASPTKLALRAAYGVLNTHGDAPQSDPHLVSDMIGRMASGDAPQQGEIVSHLGSSLTVSDAAFLNHLIGPSTPQRRADIRQLSDVVDQARTSLAVGNGSAGDAAFGRFTNWLLPALQRGGNIGELTADNQLQRFAPTVDDYKASVRRYAGDLLPMRSGNPTGEAPGITGDILGRMRELGASGYSLPKLPVTRPGEMPSGGANEANAGGGSENA